MEEVSEKTVEEAMDGTVDKGKEQKAFSGEDSYRCTFKSEWSTKWPIIRL